MGKLRERSHRPLWISGARFWCGHQHECTDWRRSLIECRTRGFHSEVPRAGDVAGACKVSLLSVFNGFYDFPQKKLRFWFKTQPKTSNHTLQCRALHWFAFHSHTIRWWWWFLWVFPYVKLNLNLFTAISPRIINRYFCHLYERFLRQLHNVHDLISLQGQR